MAARRKRFLRYPRTTQERKFNQDKNDQLIRAKRHNKRLPNAYDDFFPCSQKGWKASGRKNQYREDASEYEFHSMEFSHSNIPSWNKIKDTLRFIHRMKWYYKWEYQELIWYGKDI